MVVLYVRDWFHVDIYSFLCFVSYYYITIILIITALYYFFSIAQTHTHIYIYIAMHYYFNKTIIFIIKVRLDNLHKQYNVKLEFK